MVTRYMYHT